MMEKRSVLIILVILLLGISGCGNRERQGNILVYGSGDYTSINPAVYEHGEINALIFNGLTAHGKNNEIVPALAKRWEFDEDRNVYTFWLRDDVLWQDGEKFTAEDVKFTLDTILRPENGSEIASNYEEIKKTEVVNDYEIKLWLEESNVALLDYLTVGILPRHCLEGKDIITDSFNQEPIGTGPYQVKSWDMGQSITLVRNENFYGNKPSIDTIIFKIINDTKTRALQLESGEIDLALIAPEDFPRLKQAEKLQEYIMKTADYRGILYNFKNDFFKKNPEIPNALGYAIDRQQIIDAVLLGHGTIAYSPLQAGKYYNPIMEQYGCFPEKTKQILEEAGWKLGERGFYEKEGQELKFTINCAEGDQVRVDMAAICAQQLRAAGANVSVAVNPQIDWAGQEAYLIGWGSPFDPDDHTYKVFGTGKGSNFSGYSNPAVDRLLISARETEDTEKRKQDYFEFQEELVKDMPFTFLAYVDAVYVAKKEVTGINADAVLGHHGVGIFQNIEEWTIK